ncbi:MAG: DUF1178 family protein [Hyphomicrobiales bacterium]|nr:DUF1178 family protein [Hyphomicrobiales bacterium]MBV9740354.1 DUF1178 family protein [Hyphomicrobiales bacterium]
MISFTLACEAGHRFESWFASGSAFEKQKKRRLVTCPFCGSAKVEKSVMAPAVARTDNRSRTVETPAPAVTPSPQPAQPHAVLGEPERQLRDMIRALRKHVAENSDYVGRKFPEEARQMHQGEIEHRSIWGEASPEEAKALAEEGVEVHPLPMLPDERN